MDWLNNNSMLLAQKTLDVTWSRQRVAMDNVANIDTPGYKAKYILFEDQLKNKLGRLERTGRMNNSEVREAIRDSKMRMRQRDDESIRADGNNVNLDVEQLEIARNSYHYQFALRQINDQLLRLRTAIEGR